MIYKIKHINHIWLFACEISHVTFQILKFTREIFLSEISDEILHVKFYMSNFAMWNFISEKSHVIFHMRNFTWLWKITCKISYVKTHVVLELQMWNTRAISIRKFRLNPSRYISTNFFYSDLAVKRGWYVQIIVLSYCRPIKENN